MTHLKLGSSDVGKVYVGATPAQKVYVGATLIWSASPTPVSVFEFNEGTGTTATSTTGGYTMTVGASGWGTGTITRTTTGFVDGNVSATYSQWTLALKMRMSALSSGDRTFVANGSLFLNIVSTGQLRAYMSSTATSTATVSTGVDHVIVITQDATTLKVYLDGVSVISFAGSNPYTRGQALSLLAEILTGEIDWLRFYNVALTADQVAANA
jgi:hypothetical protein